MAVTSKSAGFHQAADRDRIERLRYLADLISELQQLADREGCDTLSRLLALSHLEASREAGRVRK